MSGGRASGEDIWLVRRFDEAAAQRERTRMLDVDSDRVPDEGRIPRQVD
jgi:hypothetical protein